MAFNHYARLKQLIDARGDDWIVVRINQPTTATRFDGTTRTFDHYYRLCDTQRRPIKYGKFQQLDRLAHILQRDIIDLPVIDVASEAILKNQS